MSKKRYKLIENIGYKNEKETYFDRLTEKKIAYLNNLNSYVLLFHSKNLSCYVPFDFKTNEYQKKLYNSNINKYCEQ